MIQRSLRLRVILPLTAGVAALCAAMFLVFGHAGLTASLASVQVATILLILLLARAVRKRERADRQQTAKRDSLLFTELREGLKRVESQHAAMTSALGKQQKAEEKNAAAVKKELAAARAQMERLVERDKQAVTQAAEREKKAVERFKRQRETADKQLRNGLAKTFSQVDALTALYYDLKPRQALPATAGWAASPDLLRFLYDTVRGEGRSRVVECGSGVSTLIVAYALKELGGGKIVALEHLDQFAEQTRRAIADHGLSEFAEVRHAPLKDVTLDGEDWPWYDTAEIPEGPFDLIIVDGPPAGTRAHARFPATPVLYERLAAEGMVVLDDHNRDEEQEIGERWTKRHPDLAPQRLKHEKGTLILRRHAAV
ncbi:MAG: class I SAM-dependent methyltransferase [Stackebrandtia sp.]